MFGDNKNNKFWAVVAVICSIILVFNSTSVYASGLAVPYPGYLPYVPPSDGALFDFISGVFGVTSLDIAEEARKAQGYWNLYRSVMGAALEQLTEDFENAFNNARTSRQLVLTPEMVNTINDALDKGIDSGVPTGGEITSITNKADLLNAISDYIPYSGYTKNITMTACESCFDSAASRFSSVTAVVMYSYDANRHGNQNPTYIYFYDASLSLTLKNDGLNYYYVKDGTNEIPVSYCVFPGGYSNVNAAPEYLIRMTAGSGEEFRTLNFGAVASSGYLYLGVHNSAIKQKLHNRNASVITPNTVLNEQGEEDKTQNMIIDLPLIWPVISTVVSGISSIWGDTITKPDAVAEEEAASQGKTLEDIIEELKEEYKTKYGSFSEYKIGLTSVFPFCIPFDIVRILQSFGAQRTIPIFSLSIPAGMERYWVIDEFTGQAYKKWRITFSSFTIDLTPYDNVMTYVRYGEEVLFVLGLAVVTRKTFLRG